MRNSDASFNQTSMVKWVRSVASTWFEMNSTPAKTRLVYFFVAFPSISTSSTSAMSKSADQVSTGMSV